MIERLTAYHDLVKSELPLAAGICVIAGQVLFLGDFASIKTTIIGFLVGFFLGSSQFLMKKNLQIILIYITSTHIHPTDAEFASIHVYYSVHLVQEVF
jgi:intracellular septation protein A